jgi:SH3-like domain-containing protein
MKEAGAPRRQQRVAFRPGRWIGSRAQRAVRRPAPTAAPGPWLRAAVAALALACGPASAQPSQAAPMIIRPSSTLGPPAAPPSGSPAPVTRGGNAVSGGHPGLAPGATPGAPPPAFALRGLPNRFRSVVKPETVLYDAPSDRAKKIFIAPAGMPVEVVSVLRDWVKFRDPGGDLAWVNREMLTDRRTVVSTALASVRRDARADAPVLFDVDRGVVFELLEDRAVAGFVKVRYQGNEIGYLQADQVWGL